MLRSFTISACLLAAAATVPALPAGAAFAVQGAGQQCAQTPARQTRRSILGGLGGALASGLLGSNRVTGTIANFVPVQSMLSDAIMNLLDCDEQRKAADATDRVTQQAERSGVGSTVEWSSESRRNVRGRSTVTAVDAAPAGGVSGGGRRCMTVTDIVIIDGEETAMPKRMCRIPPATRYARA